MKLRNKDMKKYLLSVAVSTFVAQHPSTFQPKKSYLRKQYRCRFCLSTRPLYILHSRRNSQNYISLSHAKSYQPPFFCDFVCKFILNKGINGKRKANCDEIEYYKQNEQDGNKIIYEHYFGSV